MMYWVQPIEAVSVGLAVNDHSKAETIFFL